MGQAILHGAGSGQGISISGRTNVTIKDMQIENFGNGMHALVERGKV
jgi:hypothetical protein